MTQVGGALDGTTFNELLSDDGSRLLDIIDQLRFQGVGRLLGDEGLPQLIVCGDQSSGKSSVLEALTRIRFPTKSELCTTFACELKLRREPNSRVSVRIIPGDARSAEEKDRLTRFRGSFSSPDRFPELILGARDCMAGDGASTSETIFEDVLHVEIVGPGLAPLTIVDLPGLIHYSNKNNRNVQLVTSLVQKYMRQKNSIILAVISAQNDINNQIVLDHIQQIVPDGNRTLGIITKPDLLPRGSEKEQKYLDLARNSETNFQHGWHAVRNRDYVEQSSTNEDRDRIEREFFQDSPWQGISRREVGLGIDSLRAKASKLLLDHIGASLPAITHRIEGDLEQTEEDLRRLGTSRGASSDQRRFLSDISDQFYERTKEALEGRYRHAAFFGDHTSAEGMAKRLRATVRNLNDMFAKDMLRRGHKWHLVEDTPEVSIRGTDPQPFNGHPKVITRSDFIRNHVDPLAESERGNELPGIPNPLLIGSLFQQQAEPWKKIATDHLKTVWDSIMEFLELLLANLTDERTSQRLLLHIVDPAMDERLRNVNEKLQELLTPHQSYEPINIDPQFAQNISLLREKRIARPVVEAVRRELISSGERKSPPSTDELLARLALDSEITDDKFGSSNALDFMQAYYETTMLIFVNNIAMLAVEQCLLNDLHKTFSSASIRDMDDEKLEMIAAESREILSERVRLGKRKDLLERAIGIIKGLTPRGTRVSATQRSRDSRNASSFSNTRSVPIRMANGTSGTPDRTGTDVTTDVTPSASDEPSTKRYETQASRTSINISPATPIINQTAGNSTLRAANTSAAPTTPRSVPASPTPSPAAAQSSSDPGTTSTSSSRNAASIATPLFGHSSSGTGSTPNTASSTSNTTSPSAPVLVRGDSPAPKSGGGSNSNLFSTFGKNASGAFGGSTSFGSPSAFGKNNTFGTFGNSSPFGSNGALNGSKSASSSSSGFGGIGGTTTSTTPFSQSSASSSPSLFGRHSSASTSTGLVGSKTTSTEPPGTAQPASSPGTHGTLNSHPPFLVEKTSDFSASMDHFQSITSVPSLQNHSFEVSFSMAD